MGSTMSAHKDLHSEQGAEAANTRAGHETR